MYNKTISLCLLLLAILFGCALANETRASTVSLHMFESSSEWWLAVQPRNDNSQTVKVEVKDSKSNFIAVTRNSDWEYYAVNAPGVPFTAPLTFRLTSSSGAQITVQVATLTPGALINTGATYATSASATTPSTSPTTRPVDPTTKPTTAPPTASTTRPVTPAPTNAPVFTDLCAVTAGRAEPLKILVPLYVYPGAAWDALIATASKVKIIAIINPNSGPIAAVPAPYVTYMQKMKDAGIEMVGYVYTSWGNRDVATVKADIDMYATKYPLLKGIFLDEAATESNKLFWYTQVYQHIMSKSGYAHTILNPGTQPDQGYLAVSTNIMILENYASAVASTNFNSWVKCASNASQKAGYKYKFSGVAHTASPSILTTQVHAMANMGIGLVYVTDGPGGCCTYNYLTTYFAELATAVASFNNN